MSIYDSASLLRTAIEHNRLDEVANYLDNFPDLRTLPFGVHGQTLIHVASSEGWDEVIKLLLDRKVPVDLIADGKTALHNAICDGCIRTIDLLLDNGANPNLPTDTGHSPLELVTKWRAAGEDNDDQVIETLVKHGAVLNNNDAANI